MRLTPNQQRVLEVVVAENRPMHSEDIAAACDDYETTPWTYRATLALERRGLVEVSYPDVTYTATETGREVVGS